MSLPIIKLDRGIHAMHLFYRIDRVRWSQLAASQSQKVREQLEKLCVANSSVSHPQLRAYTNIGGKADVVFFLLAAELAQISQLHRDLENCFPPGTLIPVFNYLSVTELSEYTSSDEENQQMLINEEKLQPDSEAFKNRIAELRDRMAKY